jgi:TonB family protein
MRLVTTRQPKHRKTREWMLVWAVCACCASPAALAQTDVGADEPVTPLEETPASDAAAVPDAESSAADAESSEADTESNAADAESSAAEDLTLAESDPIGTNERLVATSIAEFGRKSLQVAEAYVDLADAQRQAKQHEQAAENYLAAVEIYRSIDGPFTPLAIAPLTSLGDNYHEAADDVNAVASYSEARTVSRRAYGLHNEDQIALLDRMSRSLLDLNQLAEAEAQQVEALRLVQRSHPPESDEVLEAIYKYAEWLGERLLFQAQRDQYTRALRIIRQAYGERDVRLVKPMLGIGNTYREERNPAGPGISAMQDALALLLEQPQRDHVAIAGALRDIGDWAVAFGKTGYEGMEYQRAWETLGSAPNGEQLRRQWFSGANYVLYEPISPRGLSTDPDAASGHVTVSFDIDTAGNSTNVKLVESSPAGLKDEAVLRHIRRSRFRPLLEAGRLVIGRNLAIQVKFRYLEGTVGDEDDG